LLTLGRLSVVDDLVEVDLVEAVRPDGHRSLEEVLEGPEPQLEPPVRLVLEPADLLDRVARQPSLRLLQVDDVVVEGVLVAAVGNGFAGGRQGTPRGRSVIPSGIIGIATESVNEEGATAPPRSGAGSPCPRPASSR